MLQFRQPSNGDSRLYCAPYWETEGASQNNQTFPVDVRRQTGTKMF